MPRKVEVLGMRTEEFSGKRLGTKGGMGEREEGGGGQKNNGPQSAKIEHYFQFPLDCVALNSK